MVLVLFDIDGTLITSGGTGRRAIASALADFCGREIDMTKIALGGRTDPAIVRDILRQCEYDEDEMDELIPACLEVYASELERSIRPEHVTLLPGVQKMLDEMHGHDQYALGLITGNMQKTAYMKLGAGRIGSYFPCGGFGSDSENRNDLPLVARDRAVGHYGRMFAPEKTVVIGDTVHDITCSRHFGSATIAVSTGMGSHEHLAELDPDLLVTSLDQTDEVWSFLGSILDR
jgi:phosphoglycolate phosphatase